MASPRISNMTNSIEKTTFGNLSRSQLMAKVKSQGNTSTELRMIKLLKKYGLKGWRRNTSLDGKPDFVWRKEKVVLFVDGCFWHGHNCERNLTPKTNAEYWHHKMDKNKERDYRVNEILLKKGWKVVRVWECQLKKRPGEFLKCLLNALDNIGCKKLANKMFQQAAKSATTDTLSKLCRVES